MKLHLLHLLVPLLCALGTVLTGCVSVTRTETEAYTLTSRDTAITDAVHNAPGERDNGVVYPTSREATTRHEFVTHDSTHIREYPDFLRLGVLELAGFMGTGGTKNSYSGGLLGAYGVLDADVGVTNLSHTFTGGLIRLMPYEQRLRWFRDSPNWTLGTSLAEIIAPEMDINKSVIGVLPIYFRKRFFLRSEAPYLMVQPTLGVGFFPWQYMNIGATVDFGSWGGMNLRAYVGYVAGYRNKLLGFKDTSSRTAAFPYFGLGISVLDFVNTVEETQHEWKDYKHHAVEINAVSFDLVHSLSGTPNFFGPSVISPITGLALHFATVDYPLWAIDKHVFAGTTLFNFFVLGYQIGAMSVLPIRLGYHIALVPDELVNQTYVEYNYYPSKYFHIADQLTIDLSNVFGVSIHATVGYVTGSEGYALVTDVIKPDQGFNGAYVSFGATFSEHLFDLDKLTPW